MTSNKEISNVPDKDEIITEQKWEGTNRCEEIWTSKEEAYKTSRLYNQRWDWKKMLIILYYIVYAYFNINRYTYVLFCYLWGVPVWPESLVPPPTYM